MSAEFVNLRSHMAQEFLTQATDPVKPHRTYRLSGWIRTERVERYARLELASYEYTFTNYMDVAGSPSVCGTQESTPVEVELNSGDEAYLMPKLVLYGPGMAWFDDVLLEEKA